MSSFADDLNSPVAQTNIGDIIGYLKQRHDKNQAEQRRQSIVEALKGKEAQVPDEGNKTTSMFDAPEFQGSSIPQQSAGGLSTTGQLQPSPQRPLPMVTQGVKSVRQPLDINSPEAVQAVGGITEQDPTQMFGEMQKAQQYQDEKKLRSQKIPQEMQMKEFENYLDTKKQLTVNKAKQEMIEKIRGENPSRWRLYLDANNGDEQAAIDSYVADEVEKRKAGPPRAGKPTPALLRTETENGIPVDYYGYHDKEGNEVVTGKKAQAQPKTKKTSSDLKTLEEFMTKGLKLGDSADSTGTSSGSGKQKVDY